MKTVGADKLKKRMYVVDANAGKSFRHAMAGCSPCITRSRGRSNGHYLFALSRFMSCEEIGRLQGFPIKTIKALQLAAPDADLGGAFGDAMSLNILLRLLPRVLYAAGLVRSVVDMWGDVHQTLGRATRTMPDDLYKAAARGFA